MQPTLGCTVLALAIAYMAVAQPTTPAQGLAVFNAAPGESASGPGVQLQTSAVMEPVAQPLQSAWVSNEDSSTGESLYVTTVPLPDICRMLNVPLAWVPVDEQCNLEQQAPFSSLALGTDSHSHRQPLCAKVDVDDSANELCDMATPADTAAVVVQMRPVRSIDIPPSTFQQVQRTAAWVYAKIYRHKPFPKAELLCTAFTPLRPYLPGQMRIATRLSCILAKYSQTNGVINALSEGDWVALALMGL